MTIQEIKLLQEQGISLEVIHTMHSKTQTCPVCGDLAEEESK